MPASKSAPGTKTQPDPSIKKSSKKAKGSMRTALSSVVGDRDLDLDILVLILGRLTRIHENFAALVHKNFSSSEMLVLTALLLDNPPHRLSPSQLAERVIQTPGGMTKTLRRLEDQGFVKRLREETDRRALLVELTPQGREVTRNYLVETFNSYDQLLAGVADKERRVMLKSLRSLLSAFEQSLGVVDTTELLS